MWRRYNAYLMKPPERVVAWEDARTGARAWLVINSLRGNAAGGGTRMRVGANEREVAYLAKSMELKFALAGPAIGGAKNAIDFDPRDPRKGEVLERWYEEISPHLRAHYGTGGDLNIDEIQEVIPLVKRLGLEHPQEGVVRGHMCVDAGSFRRVIRALDEGVKAPVRNGRGVAGKDLRVADVITGYGVARSVLAWYERTGRDPDGMRVLLEGFGNVGAAVGLYLTRAGARVVGVSDAEKALIEPAGLDAAAVERLIVDGPDRLLPDDGRCRRGPARDAFFDVAADVFVCAATSGTIVEGTLDRLEAAGVAMIACGANQPFGERELGATAVHREADARFAVLADFLANCGMARTFSYLMEEGASTEARSIFDAVDATLASALDEVLDRAQRPDRGLMAATLSLGLDRIGAP